MALNFSPRYTIFFPREFEHVELNVLCQGSGISLTECALQHRPIFISATETKVPSNQCWMQTSSMLICKHSNSIDLLRANG